MVVLLGASAMMFPRAAQALVNYPPAALLQPGDITGAMLRDGAVYNAKVSSTAAIAYSKLNLTGQILDSDVSSTAAISADKIASTTNFQLVSSSSQTITGVKSFTSFPHAPAGNPAGNLDFVPLGYFTSHAASVGVGSPLPTVTLTGQTSSTVLSYSADATTTFIVPAGVTSMIVNLKGAGGAVSDCGTKGGCGGSATGTLAVTPGETLYLCLGNKPPQNGNGGFCGGGDGHGGAGFFGGGGMTWLSRNGAFSTSTVLMVAGGGGSGTNDPHAGGAGGGMTGSAGATTGAGTAGQGGTQTAGGTPNGAAGQGGASSGTGVATAGGGGYFGGGGGTANGTDSATGGGGSSFFSSGITATSTASGINSSVGTATFTYPSPFTFTGNDYGGTIDLTATVTSALIQFGTAFSIKPACTAMTTQNIYTWGSTTSSTLNIIFSSTLNATSSFMYTCL